MSQACIRALALAIQAEVPTIAWGTPGVGKTKIANAICNALHRRIYTVIPAIREPADFGGYPCPSGDGKVHMLPAGEPWANLKEGDVVFLDEISCAPPAVQSALLRPVLEGYVGDLRLPRVSWIAAANPPEQAAGGWNLAPPLANRFCHIRWATDAREWRDGMIAGFPVPTFSRVPEDWKRHFPVTYAQVASFVGANPQKLEPGVPKDESKAGGAWASPRTWEMVARVSAAVRSIGGNLDVDALLISGCVGEGVGMEFLHWRQNLDLPDPEELLANPKKFKLPSRGDLQFTVLASVAAAALSNMNKERWHAAWEIFHSAASQGAKDVAAASVRTLAAARSKHKELPYPSATILKPFIEILQAAGQLVVEEPAK